LVWLIAFAVLVLPLVVSLLIERGALFTSQAVVQAYVV
jgi:hypothetical protein